jgi:hypothetical protein
LKEGMERAVVCSSFKGHAGRKTVSATLKAENKKQDEKLKKSFGSSSAMNVSQSAPGLPDFSCYNIPKWGKLNQKTTTSTR